MQYLSSIDENRPLGIETDEVQKFLFYWDQIFLYGLKSAKRGYWNFVSTFSHPSLVHEVTFTFVCSSAYLDNLATVKTEKFARHLSYKLSCLVRWRLSIVQVLIGNWHMLPQATAFLFCF